MVQLGLLATQTPFGFATFLPALVRSRISQHRTRQPSRAR
jgi:hypothetical protein